MHRHNGTGTKEIDQHLKETSVSKIKRPLSSEYATSGAMVKHFLMNYYPETPRKLLN